MTRTVGKSPPRRPTMVDVARRAGVSLKTVSRVVNNEALLGFDDFELSHLMPRSLTVIAYDARELGRIAAELLFKRIDGDASWPTTTIVPTQLLDRGLV